MNRREAVAAKALVIARSGPIRFYVTAPPSLNVQKKWGIGQSKRFRDDLFLSMRCAMQAAGFRVTAHDRLLLATDRSKRVVSLVRFFGGTVKPLDPDNFIGGAKPALDCLKLVMSRSREYGQVVEREGLGLIFDDGAEYVTTLYDQQRDTDRAGELSIEVKSS